MSRQAPFLCLVAALLLLASCTAPTPPSTPATATYHFKLANQSSEVRAAVLPPNCPGSGSNKATGPIVCIGDDLQPSPNPVEAYQGSWIHFYLSNQDQELDIDFAEPVKFEQKGHKGNEAWVRVKDLAGPGRTKYSILNVSTGKRNDPDILIDPAPQ